jgi:hypothetical protein
MKILVDANVILDVLLERTPFFVAGTQILGSSNGDELLHILLK